MSFFENTRKPQGFGGRVMVSMMNLGHRALSNWGFSFLSLPKNAAVLDCGCGGGANIKKLLARCPQGTVKGIDYSAVSVAASQKANSRAVKAGRCQVLQASVMELPFADSQFDFVTAFETVYFWPDLSKSFREIARVLKPHGTFFLCNECSGDTDKDDKWTERIDGMTIYRDVQLKDTLEQAGFSKVQIHKNKKGWLCVTAQK